jgi:hypothetical protein
MIRLDHWQPSRHQEATSSHHQRVSPAQQTSAECMPRSNASGLVRRSKSLQFKCGAAECEQDLHHTRHLRLARPRRAELTLDRHDLRTRQALVEAEELLDGLRHGPHQSYGPRGRVLRKVQFAWSTESHSVGPQNGMQPSRDRPSCWRGDGSRLASQRPTHPALRRQPGSGRS